MRVCLSICVYQNDTTLLSLSQQKMSLVTHHSFPSLSHLLSSLSLSHSLTLSFFLFLSPSLLLLSLLPPFPLSLSLSFYACRPLKNKHCGKTEKSAENWRKEEGWNNFVLSVDVCVWCLVWCVCVCVSQWVGGSASFALFSGALAVFVNLFKKNRVL